MKATELQCYDLINVDGKPTMVYGVMARMNRVYDTMTNDISMRRCEPIPLTAEILEKNGWMYDTEFNSWWHGGVEFVIFADIKVKPNGEEELFYCAEITTIYLRYVHQLQHLLRICGLNELSDGFQV